MSMHIGNECNGTNKNGVHSICRCMNTVVQSPGPRKGIKYLMTIDRSFTRRMRIIYSDGHDEYLMEFCPFCRGELAAKDEEEVAQCLKS
jgi:hypothetical protein